MSKQKHDISYFLTNPHFIDWVKQPASHNTQFWERWLAAHPEDKEAFFNAKAIVARMSFQEADVSQSRQDEILSNVLRESNSPAEIHRTGGSPLQQRVWQWAKLAAVVVAMLGIALLYTRHDHTQEAAVATTFLVKKATAGERLNFYLPDSTRVVLHGGSELRYPSHFASNKREVSLQGEAYFDVVHDAEKKFSVVTGGIKTVVHGTAFTVKAYPDAPVMSVALERGSVTVHAQDQMGQQEQFRLVPGEKLSTTPNFRKVTVTSFDHAQEFGWKDGVLVFNNADRDDFVALIEQWYGVQVHIIGQSQSHWKVNGKFKGVGLERVLKSLEFSNNVDYKITDSQVYLYLEKY